MNWKLFAQLLVTIILAILGWWFTHYSASQRDIAAKRQDLRSRYLLESSRRLSHVWGTLQQSRETGVPEITGELKRELIRDLLSTIRDIQLLGRESQLEKVDNFLDDISQNKPDLLIKHLPSLLQDLRSDLRESMEIPGGRDEVKWFYISDLTIERPGGQTHVPADRGQPGASHPSAAGD